MDKITVRHGDTDEVPKAVGTFGSRSLQLGGSAIRQAADEVIDAGPGTGRGPAGGQPGRPRTGRGARRPGRCAVRRRRPVPSAGRRSPSAPGTASSPPTSGSAGGTPTFPFGAHVAVVEVDTETGKVVLRRIVAVDDAGPIVNPLTFRGQRHGGLAQGSGAGDAGGHATTTRTATRRPRRWPTTRSSRDRAARLRAGRDGDPDRPEPVGRQGDRRGGDDRLDPGGAERRGGRAGRISACGTWTCPPHRSGSGRRSTTAREVR